MAARNLHSSVHASRWVLSALLFAVVTINVTFSTKLHYTLKINVDHSAVRNIREQKLNLVILKGYYSQGVINYNTAWITEKSSNLLSGYLTYKWRPQNKAAFYSSTTIGQTLRDQETPDSPIFYAGDMARYDGCQWSVKSLLNPPEIGLNYDYDAVALYPALKAPYIDRDGDEKWSVYFAGDAKMAASKLEGTPTYTLALRMGAKVKQQSFTGDIIGSEFYVRYEGTVKEIICLYSPANSKKVAFKDGRC